MPPSGKPSTNSYAQRQYIESLLSEATEYIVGRLMLQIEASDTKSNIASVGWIPHVQNKPVDLLLLLLM